jgi:lysophospholipase L1-like esterase
MKFGGNRPHLPGPVGLRLALAGGMVLSGLALPLSARRSPGPPDTLPVVAGSGYLALGDSVTFGYREPDTSPTPDYAKAQTFVGYPEDIGATLDLKVTNAACSGETSGSFINQDAQSNGCERTVTGGPGYRSTHPLHVSYRGSQLAFAVGFLKTHAQTRLVSLMIGANDAFACLATTGDDCVKEFPTVLKKLRRNVTVILKAIRRGAGYHGQIVIVEYYSTDYANAIADYETQALNSVQTSAARPFHVEIAGGYRAFEAAAAHSGGNPCTAGLLTRLTGPAKGTCGVHPSLSGQSVLARAVEDAIEK